MKRILLLAITVLWGVPAFAIDIQQGSSSTPLEFFCKDSSDAAITGLSPTVTINKNGGSFASPSGSVTEIANGLYKVAGNATDTNTLGLIYLKAVCSGGVTFLFPVANVVDAPTVQNLVDGVLDEATSSHTTGGSVGKAIGDTATNIGTLLAAEVIRSGTAQAGSTSTITLDSGASATNNLYAGAVVIITSSTGVSQVRTIVSYVGSTKVATVNRAWVTNPSSSSVFSLVTP